MNAYKEGREARVAGHHYESNPYVYGTAEWTYWWDGWQDANSRFIR